MSRVIVKPNAYAQSKQQGAKIASTSRAFLHFPLKNVNTSGLTSAQIDAIVFLGGGVAPQPWDGAQATDTTNALLLTRLNGHWYSVSLTLIP